MHYLPARMRIPEYLSNSHRTAVVAAHPDDETIGAAGCLAELRELIFIHVTDGAPHDMRDAVRSGFLVREAYAAARRREFQDALSAAEIAPRNSVTLPVADQEASLQLANIARELSRLLEDSSVDVVLAHAYEGGHPDHDAASFAVHAACRLLPAGRRPAIVEYTSYHGSNGQMRTGNFLPASGPAEATVALNADEQARKRRMLECFRTQSEVLRPFGVDQERFRPAPSYDFTTPPHQGQLWYEKFPWGMTGCRWRELARAAAEELGLC